MFVRREFVHINFHIYVNTLLQFFFFFLAFFIVRSNSHKTHTKMKNEALPTLLLDTFYRGFAPIPDWFVSLEIYMLREEWFMV